MDVSPSARPSGPRRPLSVTVILPTLPLETRRPLVTRALSTALSQARQAAEILVVADGPAPDDWIAGLERTGLLRPPVRLIALPRRAGHVRARIAALSVARGSHIAFLDDDDVWLPDHLGDLVEALRASGAHAAYSDAEVVTLRGRAGPDPQVLERRAFAFDWDPDFLREYNFVIPSAFLYDRSLHRTVGTLAARAGHHWDWDFLLRLSANGVRPARAPRATVLYTVDVDGANESARLGEMAVSAAALMRHHGLEPVSGHNFRTMLDETTVERRLRPTTLMWTDTALPGLSLPTESRA